MHRPLAALALAVSLSLPAAALADVPAPDASTDDASTTTGTGPAYDPNCNLAAQSVDGTTCQICTIAGTDQACADQLGDDYKFVCQASASAEVWCNGPSRDVVQDPGSCALTGAPAPLGMMLLAGALAACALVMRRRAR